MPAPVPVCQHSAIKVIILTRTYREESLRSAELPLQRSSTEVCTNAQLRVLTHVLMPTLEI
jgi:hypothetical protein